VVQEEMKLKTKMQRMMMVVERREVELELDWTSDHGIGVAVEKRLELMRLATAAAVVLLQTKTTRRMLIDLGQIQPFPTDVGDSRWVVVDSVRYTVTSCFFAVTDAAARKENWHCCHHFLPEWRMPVAWMTLMLSLLIQMTFLSNNEKKTKFLHLFICIWPAANYNK
jgi:hypothetical protein